MKPGVFSQLYIQLVFAAKYRDRLLRYEIRKEVFSYMSGIVTNLKIQEEHHKIRTFREEYIEFLEKFEIEYDKKHLFEFFD